MTATSALRPRKHGGGSRAYTAADYRKLAWWYDRVAGDYADALTLRQVARTPQEVGDRRALGQHRDSALRQAVRFTRLAVRQERAAR